MILTDTRITKVRTVLLCITGLSCLLYAVLAIAQNRPDPIWWFIPSVTGGLAMIGIFAAFSFASPAARRMAQDEMYIELSYRAQRHAYWISVALYPIFAAGSFWGGLEWVTVFAAIGTLVGASYLLLLTFYEWRVS